MNHPVRNCGQNSTSRNIRKKGRKVNPSYPSGNHMYPLQGGNHMYPLQGGNQMYPLQGGGSHMYPMQGGNRLYPIQLVASHLYPLAVPGAGNRMIPIGGWPEVIPSPPLPIFCGPPPRSAFLESLDEKTEWVKWRHLSDEEHARVIEQCVSSSKAFRNGGYKANKPGYSKYDGYY